MNASPKSVEAGSRCGWPTSGNWSLGGDRFTGKSSGAVKNRDLLRFILSIRAAGGRILTCGRRTILAIAGEGDTALDLDIYDGNGPASYSITWLDLLICFPLDAVEITHAELAALTDEWRRR